MIIQFFPAGQLVKEFICTCVLLPSLLTGEESVKSCGRCKTISAALMILTVAAILIFWLGMPTLINAHVNQTGNKTDAGQLQDSQQHTSSNTAAGVLYIYACALSFCKVI